MKFRFSITLAFLLLAARPIFAQNFTGTSQQVTTAEQSRKNLSQYWFGEEFPQWNSSCRISARIGLFGAGGETGFIFNKGEVFGWRMHVQGSSAAVQRDVIPHEVNHTVFATKYRRPLPRVFDEGAATFVESRNEHEKRRKMLKRAIQQNKFIPFRQLIDVKKYPQSGADTQAIYTEGFAIVEYLVNHKGGPHKFARFLGDTESPAKALKVHYGYNSPDALESEWYAWYSHVAGYG